jgi:hypothetical protein
MKIIGGISNENMEFLKNLHSNLQANENNFVFWRIVDKVPTDTNQTLGSFEGCYIEFQDQLFLDDQVNELKALILNNSDYRFSEHYAEILKEETDLERLYYILYNNGVPVTWTQYLNEESNFFFSEEACMDYINSNKNQFNLPRPCSISINDNPELIRLVDMIKTTDWVCLKEKMYREQLNHYQLQDAQAHYEDYIERHDVHLPKPDKSDFQTMVDNYNHWHDCNNAENDMWFEVVDQYVSGTQQLMRAKAYFNDYVTRYNIIIDRVPEDHDYLLMAKDYKNRFHVDGDESVVWIEVIKEHLHLFINRDANATTISN